MGLLLAGRMAWLAVAENEHYELMAESNRVNMTLVPPRRGWIVDRNGAPIANKVAANMDWLQWLYAEAGPALIVGLLVLTVVGAILGYGASVLGWRWWIARKWRSRHNKRI